MRPMGSVTIHPLISSSLIISSMLYWLPVTPTASAEQLITLGQERAQAQTSDSSLKSKSSIKSKIGQPAPTRKSHKLIKKSQTPTASLVEVPASSPTSTEKTGSQSLTATPMAKSTDSTLLAPTSTTTSSSTVTSTSLLGAVSPSLSQTSLTPTASVSTGVAATGSTTSRGGSAGGKSLQRLSDALPGLTQILAPAPTTPTISRTPATLAFSAVQNGTSPASQTVTISNIGTGTLSWTATPSVAWLTLNGSSTASGTNSGSFSAGVNASGLSVGTYNGSIAIAASGATNTPQAIAVSLTVTTAPTPTIGLSTSTVSFTGIQGGSNPPSQNLTITNTGAGTLSWTMAESAPWLTLSALSGTGNGTVALSVNTAGMTAGSYSTPITVNGTGATNTPQTVVVNLTISAPQIPTISLSPASLSFNATQGGSNPAGQPVTITNSGTGTLSWAVSTTASWLSLSPLSGTAPSSFTVTTNIAGLAAGTYSSTITVTGTGATNTPQSIPVTLTIAAAPSTTLTVSPTNLTFTATQGAANPANQSFTVTSNTSWTVTTNGSWLSVGSTSGSNNGTVTVSVNTATATVGTNTGTITITGNGITRTITVTLSLSSAGSSSAVLTWNASTSTDVATYRIYQSNTSGVYGAPIATVPAGTLTFTAGALQVGSTYYFVVTAVDSFNNESQRSNEVTKSIF